MPYIFWVTVAAGSICLIAGIVFLCFDYTIRLKSLKAVADAKQAADTGVREHGAVSGVIDSVANLAKELRWLSIGVTTLVMSLAFFAIAAMAAGLDAAGSAMSP